MNKRRVFLFGLLSLLILSQYQTAFAHPGRTDSNGGHWDKKSGTYHYHNEGSSGSGSSPTSKAVPASSITLTVPSQKIYIGDSTRISLTFTPSNVTDKGLVWSSSNEKVATISSDGTLTALSAGNVIIAAETSNGKTDQFELVIYGIEAESIAFVNPPVHMEIGTSGQLICSFTPENTTEKAITWKSSDENILSVDENGNISAVSPGSAKITAVAVNNVEASWDIEVLTIEVERIEIDIPAVQYNVGDIADFHVSIFPENATNQKYTISISDTEIARIIDENSIQLLKSGELTITATSMNEKESSSKINIIQPVTEIIADQKSLSLVEGERTNISYSIVPKDATLQSITWRSLDESIAAVDETGNVLAVKEGETTVKAMAHNNIEINVPITVTKPVLPFIYFLIPVIVCGVGFGGYMYRRSKAPRK